MAKDRFSKQKKSYYNNEFRYGIDSLIEKNKPVEKPKLEKQFKKKLIELKTLSHKLTTWEINFVESILERNQVTSLKQRATIDKIFDRLKKINTPKIIYNNPESNKK
jgi:hypothetical protein